jgi:hypothetical protein
MTDFDLKQTQRYYHLVALRGTKDMIKTGFFRDWHIEETGTYEIKGKCSIFQMLMTSDYQYYQGDTDRSPNENGDGSFVFDLLIVECLENNMTVLCFPFKKMAIDLVTALLSTYNILADSRFIKVDLHKLLRANDESANLIYKQNCFLLSGISFSMTNSSLSSVRLIGEHPLDSDIYKDYFKEKLNNFGLEKSTVKCEVKTDFDDRSVKLTSTFHIDRFGNYKFYLQSKGQNLWTIPEIFDLLKYRECTLETLNNPLNHILKDME